MARRTFKRWLAVLLAALTLIGPLSGITAVAEQAQPQKSQIVLTLGADLSGEQKANILRYFGITEAEVTVITITNADEHARLGKLLPAEVIGRHTLSCAMVRPMSSGGVQVKTANMNYVDSNMIASTLVTSGVYNCEVLTAAPFEVSGTGALTGVMMAYETAMGFTLEEEKKDLANEELVITGEISNSVGRDQATLVVNDIKIHIIRDGITDQAQVNQVVDEVIAVTENAAAVAAQEQGKAAPAKLGTVETEKLYSLGYKFSQMNYSYAAVQPTLERVTRNVTKSSGIVDPITDTFTTTDDDQGLSIDSILLGTDDRALGNNALISATSNVALGDHPAETIDVYTGDVTLTKAGTIKANAFIDNTNVVIFKDLNGSYALMDLNGNVLTESIYADDFSSRSGHIRARIDNTSQYGLLRSDGSTLIPFQYDVIEVYDKLWGAGIRLTAGTDDDYDYYSYFHGARMRIDTADIYYFGGEESVVLATLSRSQLDDAFGFGDYLNVKDRNGTVTTYDSSFQAVQNPSSLYDSSFDESYRAAEVLSKQMDLYINRFRGNYATASGRRTGYGVVDRYGNIIVPLEFDSITSWDENLVANGYFAGRKGDGFVYIVQGGRITNQTNINYYDVNNYGMAGYVKGDSGYTLVSGDGRVVNLGTTYSSLRSISVSKGLLWKGVTSDNKYDLLDWHGNLLLSGAKDYSVSANGNYVIAQDGYTSSTLYMVNDASPVGIIDSAGAASEQVAEIREGVSLEAYTGEPTVQYLGTTIGEDFIDGTELVVARQYDTGKRAILHINGQQLTDALYDYFDYSNGWIKAEADGKNGLLAMNGATVFDCAYEVIQVLNENWAVAYTLSFTANENDYDFSYYGDNGRQYCYIDKAVICHMSEEEVSAVTLTRDQLEDVAAEGQFINIKNRSTGSVTTYDSEFNAVVAVDSLSDFKSVSPNYTLERQLRDATGYYLEDNSFTDGYSVVYSYQDNGTLYGVIDMSGNEILPAIYERIKKSYEGDGNHVCNRGYFLVKMDGKLSFVTKGGEPTSDQAYLEDNVYTNGGIALSYKEEDGTFTLVAADGTVNKGYERLSMMDGDGLFWRTSHPNSYGYDLIDWHGNVVFEDIYHVEVSNSGNYILVQPSYGEMFQVYGVDGAMPEGGMLNQAPAEPEATEEPIVTEAPTPTPEPAATEAPAATETPLTTEAPAATAEPAATEAPAVYDETAPKADYSAASGLISSSLMLLEADGQGNKTAVVTLLNQAQTMLETDKPDVAGLISSAVTLLSVDGMDASSAITLLQAAQSALQ